MTCKGHWLNRGRLGRLALMAVATTSLGLTAGAWGQQEDTYRGTMEPSRSSDRSTYQSRDQYGGSSSYQTTTARSWPTSETRVRQATLLIGKQVRNWSNEDLGDVVDLAISRSEGKVVYAVVARRETAGTSGQRGMGGMMGGGQMGGMMGGGQMGGMMGERAAEERRESPREEAREQRAEERGGQRLSAAGERLIAVPFEALRLTSDNEYFILDIPKSRFDRLPAFEQDRWPSNPNMTLSSQLLGMGQERISQPLGFERGESQSRGGYESDQSRSDQFGRESDRFGEQRSGYGRETESDRVGGRATGRQGTVDWSSEPNLRWTNKVSRLIGADVSSRQGQDLGRIENLAIDLREGRIAYVILAVNQSSVQTRDELVALPWQTLRLDRQQARFVANVDPQTLRQARSFSRQNIPDLSNPEFGRQVYRTFGEEPYWAVYGYEVFPVEPIERGQRRGGMQREEMRREEMGPRGEMRGEGRMQTYSQLYNSDREQTFTGRVTNIRRVQPMAGLPDILEIQVQREGGQTANVQLGPASLVQDRLNLRQDSQVQVIGAQTTIDGQQVILARQLTIDGQTYQLRDRTGQPTWENLTPTGGTRTTP